jgi:hypothetical protein
MKYNQNNKTFERNKNGGGYQEEVEREKDEESWPVRRGNLKQ